MYCHQLKAIYNGKFVNEARHLQFFCIQLLQCNFDEEVPTDSGEIEVKFYIKSHSSSIFNKLKDCQHATKQQLPSNACTSSSFVEHLELPGRYFLRNCANDSALKQHAIDLLEKHRAIQLEKVNFELHHVEGNSCSFYTVRISMLCTKVSQVANQKQTSQKKY